MLESLDKLNALYMQIVALLDLMQCQEPDCADVNSTKVASEMCLTMLDELMAEIRKIEKEVRK